MKQNVDVNFTPGIHTTMANVSTNIDSYYPTLAQAYSEGWRLTSFYRVPGAKQQAFMSTAVNIPFQGIFTKYVLHSDSWLACVARARRVCERTVSNPELFCAWRPGRKS